MKNKKKKTSVSCEIKKKVCNRILENWILFVDSDVNINGWDEKLFKQRRKYEESKNLVKWWWSIRYSEK